MLHRPGFCRDRRATTLALRQLIGVNGTGLVFIEAEFERVLQMAEPEKIRAATVRPVQKRAVIAHVMHDSRPRKRASRCARSPA
jgi:hypothetical protein